MRSVPVQRAAVVWQEKGDMLLLMLSLVLKQFNSQMLVINACFNLK